MLRHTAECRQRGYPFIADPSQQLAFSEGELIRDLIDGAAYLFSNEYESHMIESKTGWSADEILARVGTQVTTLGADGVRILARDADADRGQAAAGRARPSSRPASATRSAPASWPALEWGLGHERPPRSAACSRRTSSRRSAPRSTPSPPSSSSSGSGCPTATTPRPTIASAPRAAALTPAHDVARHAVRGGLLADVLLPASSGTTPARRPRGRVGRPRPRRARPTATSPMRRPAR